MKDFLNNLADQEEVKKNPFKAFAAYTALKFEECDLKGEAIDKKVKESETEILRLKSGKLDEKTFNLFLRDYDAFKAKMTVYVVIGTVAINVAIQVALFLLKNV